MTWAALQPPRFLIWVIRVLALLVIPRLLDQQPVTFRLESPFEELCYHVPLQCLGGRFPKQSSLP